MNVTILTDASFCHKTNLAGYGYWIASERGKNGGGGPFKARVKDNNCAEMMAICNALYIAQRLELVQHGDKVLVQTDSNVSIGALTGKHPPSARQAVDAVNYFKEVTNNLNLTVVFRHVKAHTGKKTDRHVANHMCDIRAKDGLRQAREQMKDK